MKKITIMVCILIGFLITMTSCHKNTCYQNIDLTIQFNTPLYSNILTDITYKWKLKEGVFPYNPDYKVFVHFWQNSTAMMLLQDDHDLPLKPDQWKAGSEFEYTHKSIYIPNFIDYLSLSHGNKETIMLSVGLYNPNKESNKKILINKKLEIIPRPMEYPKITYAEGWYPEESIEYKTISPWRHSWRWTQKEAVIIADNVGKDLKLYIYGQIKENIQKDQTVLIKLNDQVIDQFTPSVEIFKKDYHLTKEDLGEKDEFLIKIEIDQTFIPSQVEKSEDNRELGIRIYLINLIPVNQ